MKKMISLLVVLAMICCLFAACGGEGNTDNTTAPSKETDPTGTTGGEEDTVKITDGYYFIAIEGGRDCYVHFSEDGTYYGSYFGGSVTDAGTWELVDEAVDYYKDQDGDGIASEADGDPKMTSTQAIKMTSYTTGTPVLVAYDNDTLHNMSMKVATRTLYHNPEFVYDMDKEIAIQLYVYYANNNIGSTFVLNHNKTFEDVTGDAFETGTWEMTGVGEYKLTYDFDGSTADLKVDGATATISKADGTVVDLKDDYKEEVVRNTVLALTNDTFSIQGMAATVILYGYDDGVCELVVDMGKYGSSVVDQGTFEVSAAMKPTFTFDTAGEISGTPDYGSASAETGISITAQYTATTSVGEMDLELIGNYNPNGISAGGSETEEVEVLGTVIKGDGVYTCNIVVSGNELGVEIQIAELAESGEVTVACGGGTMTCTYTYDGTYLTLAGGDDAGGYLVHFKDAIIGTWEVAK